MNNREIKVSVKDIHEVIEQLQQAEEKINNLQSKIDKANELLDQNYNNNLWQDDVNYIGPNCYKELKDILKEE